MKQCLQITLASGGYEDFANALFILERSAREDYLNSKLIINSPCVRWRTH